MSVPVAWLGEGEEDGRTQGTAPAGQNAGLETNAGVGSATRATPGERGPSVVEW